MVTKSFNIHQLVRVEGNNAPLPAWIKEFHDESIEPADIKIEWLEKIDCESRFADGRDSAYSAAGLLAVTKGDKKLLVPIEKLGQESLSIQLEQGAKSLPLFEQILHLTAFTKGAIPLHASAFQHHGEGVIVSAFPHGGKTSLLLSAMLEKANFISDDWLYLTSYEILGLPIPLSIRSWQAEQLPDLKRKPKQSLMKLAAQLSRGFPKLSSAFDKRAGLSLAAEKLFPEQQIQRAKANIFCLSIVHESEAIRVEEASKERFLALLMEMQMHEWESFLRLYRLYRAEFPEKKNTFLDDFEGHLRKALEEKLAGLRLYCIYHPYPVSLKALYQAFETAISTKDK